LKTLFGEGARVRILRAGMVAHKERRVIFDFILGAVGELEMADIEAQLFEIFFIGCQGDLAQKEQRLRSTGEGR
jgi:hypothetical protein